MKLDMKLEIGDVLEVAGTLKVLAGDKHDHVEMSYQAGRGKSFKIIYLGCGDRFIPIEARKALMSMGWVPGPSLQAMFDAEKSAN